MKAIVHERYGPPHDALTFDSVAEPSIAAGDVLVRVRAVGVAIGDWLITQGLPYIARPSYGIRRPKQRIAGLEFAGEIEAVGPEVKGYRGGDRVFGWGSGALAERIAVPHDAVATIPPHLGFEEAATIPVSGFAALQAVRDAGAVEAGDHVLVTGASGAVGTLAVQITKALGGEVTAVCGTRNVDMVRSLGADHVIDYTTDGMEIGQGYDVIVDLAGNRSVGALRKSLRPDGTLVIVGGSGGRWTMGFERTIGGVLRSPVVSQRIVAMLSKPGAGDLRKLVELLETRRVTPLVDRMYPLDAAPDAIEHVGERHGRGKTVVTV